MAVILNVVGAYDGRELARAEAQLATLRKTAQASSAGMATGFQNAGRKISNAGAGMAAVGGTLTRKLSLPLLAVGAYAVKTQADFEQSMNTLSVAANVTGKPLANLEQLAKDMGAATVFSAGDAADAMVELAKAGMKPAEIQAGALKSTMDLAATEGLNLADAGTIVSNAMATFGIKGKDASTVANALAGASKASTATVASMSQALGQVGVGASDAGLSIQETTGILAAFDQAGIKGSDAGTSLKTMLSRLVPQTDKQAKAMKRLHLSFVDQNGEFVGAQEMASRIQKTFRGMSDEERTAAMNTIFGSDARRAATVLMREGAGGLGKFIKATKDQTAAQSLADARMKGTRGALERMKGSVETAALAFGEALAPTVVKVAGGIEKAANAFQGLDKHTQTVIATAGMFLLALGPVVAILGRVTQGVGKTITGVGKLATGLGKAGKAGAGFAQGLRQPQSGLSAFASKSQRAGSAVSRSMTAMGRGVVTAMKGVGRAAVVASQAVARAMAMMARAVARAMIAIGRAMLANPWMIAVAAVIVAVILIIKNWDKVKRATLAVWHAIQRATMAVWHAIRGVITSTVNKIRSVVGTVFGVIKTIIGTYVHAYLTVIKTAFHAILAVVKFVVGQVKQAIHTWAAIIGAVAGIFGKVVGAVKHAFGRVVSFVTGIPAKIVSALGDLGSLLTDAGKKVIEGLVGGITGAFGKVKNALGSLTKKLTSWKGPPAKDKKLLTPAGEQLIDGLVDGIVGSVDKVKDTLRELTDYIDEHTTKANKKTADKLRQIIKTEKEGLLELARQRDRLANQLDDAKDRLEEAISVEKDYAEGLTESIVDFANVTAGVDEGPLSAAGIIENMQADLKAAQEFAKDLDTLTRRGLNDTSLQQIADAGVEGGSAVADALAHATDAQIRQMNKLQAEVNKTAKKTGDAVAKTLYQAGVDAARGIVDGLRSQEKALEKEMRHLGKTMAKSLEKELGIHSPSRVFERMARQIPAGVVRGVNYGRDAVARTIAMMVNTPDLPGHRLALAAAGNPGRLASAARRTVAIHPGAVQVAITGIDPSNRDTVAEVVHAAVASAFRDLVVEIEAA